MQLANEGLTRVPSSNPGTMNRLTESARRGRDEHDQQTSTIRTRGNRLCVGSRLDERLPYDALEDHARRLYSEFAFIQPATARPIAGPESS
jgi:hypothetical protein